MLNFGLWASKGMVQVPDLSGLSTSAAVASIQNAHLVASDGGSTSTSNSALNGQIASQLPNAGDLVDYETSVSYIYYNYVPAPTPTPTPVPTDPPQNSSISGISISGTTCTITGSFPQNATNISVNGTNIGSWSYSPSSLSFDVSSYAYGTLTVQVYNGRTPLLPQQSVSWGSTPTPTPSSDPAWITQPYISSTTSSSITYSWQASNVQSWRITYGGTNLVDEGNGGANGGFVSGTRSGLSASTSYTSTIRVYSGLNQTGVSISLPVSGQSGASAPSNPTPTPNPTCTPSDGPTTYGTVTPLTEWTVCSGGTQTRSVSTATSFVRTYSDCSTATITGAETSTQSQGCTSPTPTPSATYTTSGPQFNSSPSCPAGSTIDSGDSVYVQGSTSTSISNGNCGSVSVYAYAGSGVYFVRCCKS